MDHFDVIEMKLTKKKNRAEMTFYIQPNGVVKVLFIQPHRKTYSPFSTHDKFESNRIGDIEDIVIGFEDIIIYQKIF